MNKYEKWIVDNGYNTLDSALQQCKKATRKMIKDLMHSVVELQTKGRFNK